jgi:hypothetical protein
MDQNGTVHDYDYDKLGRKTQDRVTTLGAGVDGAVRRIATTYEVRGMAQNITSYDNATVGSGSVVNDVMMAYNSFGQLTADYQSHTGAVNTGSTPKTQYAYANGSANQTRPMSMKYPNGRVLNYDYGSGGGMNDALSRVGSLIDNDGTTHLTDYSYLGLGAFVENDYTEPQIKYTLVGTAGGNDPDTGDIYRGMDRFSRIKDLLWYNYGSAADVERVKHGYDRVGNRTYRMNTVDPNRKHDEYYWYDRIHRLDDMERGTLDGGNTGIEMLEFAQCWSLDATGNWSNFREDDDGDGVWDLAQGRTSNEANEISAVTTYAGPSWVTPAYDAAGNMTTIPKPSDSTTAFAATYDAWNRLVALNAEGTDEQRSIAR